MGISMCASVRPLCFHVHHIEGGEDLLRGVGRQGRGLAGAAAICTLQGRQLSGEEWEEMGGPEMVF